MSYSNCGGRDFTKEWKTLNKNVELNINEHDQDKNKKIIVLTEAYPINPKCYDVEILKEYKAVITWNSKFYNKYKDILKIYLMSSFTYTYDIYDNHVRLDNFIDFDNKINGICLISNLLTFYDEREGGCGYKKLEVMNNIEGLISHVYGGTDCGSLYNGPIGEIDSNFIVVDSYKYRIDKLKKLNEYRFTLAFENCYHELWSWDYITEKIFDAFKSKTVAIYYGCYNIEQRIPNELYIDFREFNNNYNELSNYLLSFPKEKYNKMINNAYDFYLSKEPFFLNDLKKLIKRL